MRDVNLLLHELRRVRDTIPNEMVKMICTELEWRLITEMNQDQTHLVSKPKWDRKAYMRNYMRRYRAKF